MAGVGKEGVMSWILGLSEQQLGVHRTIRYIERLSCDLANRAKAGLHVCFGKPDLIMMHNRSGVKNAPRSK